MMLKHSGSSSKLKFLIEKERELISRVRLGDAEQAISMYRELLDIILASENSSLHGFKARVLEVNLVISRAVIDGGANYYEVLQANRKFVFEISRLSSYEDVLEEGYKNFSKYVKSRTNQNCSIEAIVLRVKEFIHKNYYRNLTLNQIAKHVFLSPYYISHLFKESQGITVIDYLTRVRLENAKNLLRNPNYTINEISERIGYRESSYFCKVFRRKVGSTPSQFRKSFANVSI